MISGAFSQNRFSLFAFLLVSLVFIWAKYSQIHSSETYWKRSTVIGYDVYGYYLHLPATVIHHDPGIEDRTWFDSLNHKYQSGDPIYQVLDGPNGRMVNVYPTGIAIAWLPFFLAGHAAAGIGGYPQDGLSSPYQAALVVAGLFYAILGFWLLRKLLLKFVSDRTAALVLFFIAIGTNLFHYATYDNAMPHILIFPFDVLIILLTISWHENPRKRTAFFLGLTIGLVTIARPSEFIWILVPLLWGIDSFAAMREKFRMLLRHWQHVFLLGIGMIIFGSVQIAYWKYTSGYWVSNNHVEGFDFFRPFTLQVLFSYKKGWLLYTPLMALAIAGLVLLYRWNKKLFVPLFAFFIINLWVLSSWECWWYAASYGQRPFVQSYGLMALPLAFLFEKIRFRKILNGIFISLAVLLTALNQFQVWQLMHGILDPLLMTKAYYWEVFGKTKIGPDTWKLLEINRYNPPPPEQVIGDYQGKEILFVDYETRHGLRSDAQVCDTMGFNSAHCEMLDQNFPYGVSLKIPYDSVTTRDHLRVKMECDAFIPAENFDKELSLTCYMTGNRKQTYGYNAIPVQRCGAQPGQWTHASAWFITPEILHDDDVFSVVIWNNGGARVWLDNFRVTVYELKSAKK